MTSLLGETAISTAAHKHAALHQPKPEGIFRLSLRSAATPSHLRRPPSARSAVAGARRQRATSSGRDDSRRHRGGARKTCADGAELHEMPAP
jgi:hypothetical protein